MDTETKRNQVILQSKAVAHMARALASVNKQFAEIVLPNGGMDDCLDQIGNRTARHMELLGDILNGMDAVDGDKDAWMDPVFSEAHRLWPHKPA